jgi:hypothetical protein
MPIRTYITQLSDEALREKLGVKRRAKPRELASPGGRSLFCSRE